MRPAPLIATLLLAGCSAPPVVERVSPPPAGAAAATTAEKAPESPNWSRVAGPGPFSAELPPRLMRTDVRGIDSAVAEFAGGGLRVGFDYGWHGGLPQQWPGALDWRSGPITAGGRAGRFISYRTEPREGSSETHHFTASFAGLDPLPGDAHRQPVSLNVFISCVSEAVCTAAPRIAESVRFEPRSAARAAAPINVASKIRLVTVTTADGPVHLLQSTVASPDRAYDSAASGGRLVLRDGCLELDSAPGRALIWPAEASFDVQAKPGVLRLTDPHGRVVRVGDRVSIGGGGFEWPWPLNAQNAGVPSACATRQGWHVGAFEPSGESR